MYEAEYEECVSINYDAGGCSLLKTLGNIGYSLGSTTFDLSQIALLVRQPPQPLTGECIAKLFMSVYIFCTIL